jgi:hypothetical protein
MGILEQIQETLNILLVKVNKIEEAINKDSPIERDPYSILSVKEICEILGICRSEFQRNYSNLPFLIRTKNGGRQKCLWKDLKKYIENHYS